MQIEAIYSLFLEANRVTTDTRSIQKGSIFFALKGEKFNANAFVEQAFDKGAAYVVVDEVVEENWKTKYGERLIVVHDVLGTLQQLAGYHRKQFKCPVLAITGSNGKTTTKELVAAVMSKKYKTYATKGNLNNQIGIPLTLLSIKNDVEFAVIEMGANHKGEISSYCKYVQPDFGLITNVGLAHIEGFGGFEGVVEGKTELYRDIASRKGKLFVSADNELLIEKVPDLSQMVSYGKSLNSYCRGELASSGEFLALTCDGVKITTHLVGDYNFENVMSAVCLGKYFGVTMQQIREAIESYVPANNRSQKIISGTNTIILDAYNANPSSMREALENFEKLFSAGKRQHTSMVILGEMMELGEYSKAEHEKIVTAVSGNNWDGVKKIFVGKGFYFLKSNSADAAKTEVLWFETTTEAKYWYDMQPLDNFLILIKGSRKNELEKLLSE